MKVEIHISAPQKQIPETGPVQRISIAAGRFVRGRDIELRYRDEYLQWRYAGESDWNDLIFISSGSVEKAIDVKIFSDNGNIFKNGDVATTLIALVTDGKEDISEKLTPSSFSWEKTSNNPDTDLIFNETHTGNGRVLVITPDDVYGRATFTCVVKT